MKTRKEEILEKIEEFTGNFEKPDLSKMEELITEILKFFEYSREKLQATDEADRKAALQDLQDIQKKLDELAKKALEKAGITQDQLSSFMANPQNFLPKDQDKIQKIQREIQSTQNYIKP